MIRTKVIEGRVVKVSSNIEETMTIEEFNRIYANKLNEISKWEKTLADSEEQLKNIPTLSDDDNRKLEDPIFKHKLELLAAKQARTKVQATHDRAIKQIEALKEEAKQLGGPIEIKEEDKVETKE